MRRLSCLAWGMVSCSFNERRAHLARDPQRVRRDYDLIQLLPV